MNTTLVGGHIPLWAESLTSVLVVAGAAFAAIGSFGLVRMPDFYRRIHTPTLGATFGVWSMALANVVYFSVQQGQLFLHAVLLAIFVAITAPVTTIFLMRAALFRDRLKQHEVPPTVASESDDALADPAVRTQPPAI